jgi:thioredoxin reductase (NADPH)
MNAGSPRARPVLFLIDDDLGVMQGRVPLLLETSVPGVFAIGDVRYRAIKRVASAVGDGATAVRLTHEYLSAEDPAASP